MMLHARQENSEGNNLVIRIRKMLPVSLSYWMRAVCPGMTGCGKLIFRWANTRLQHSAFYGPFS